MRTLVRELHEAGVQVHVGSDSFMPNVVPGESLIEEMAEFVAAGDRLYVTNQAGETFVLAASPEFKLLARNPLGEGSHSTPCVAGDRIYFKTFTHLVCLGGK